VFFGAAVFGAVSAAGSGGAAVAEGGAADGGTGLGADAPGVGQTEPVAEGAEPLSMIEPSGRTDTTFTRLGSGKPDVAGACGATALEAGAGDPLAALASRGGSTGDGEALLPAGADAFVCGAPIRPVMKDGKAPGCGAPDA